MIDGVHSIYRWYYIELPSREVSGWVHLSKGVIWGFHAVGMNHGRGQIPGHAMPSGKSFKTD